MYNDIYMYVYLHTHIRYALSPTHTHSHIRTRTSSQNPAGMKTTWSGQIFIKTNTTVLIDVTSEDTVFSVKEKVPGVERLLFKGLDLDDESTLESYGIIKGQTLYAAMRSLGGGGGASKNKKAAGGRGSASDLSSKPPSGVIVRNNTDVEKVLKSLDIERVMAAMMFRDIDQDPLSAFFEMDKRQVKKGVVDAVEPIIELICAAINKKKVAKNDNSGGGKFNNPLQGGPIEEFYKVSVLSHTRARAHTHTQTPHTHWYTHTLTHILEQ